MSARIFVTALWACVVCDPALAITGAASPGNRFDDAYHVVRVIGSNNGYCSGVALSKRAVLTTAHCAVPGFRYIVNAIDTALINIEVKASFIHPDFDVTAIREHKVTADVGVLVLESQNLRFRSLSIRLQSPISPAEENV
jgi:Trypsin